MVGVLARISFGFLPDVSIVDGGYRPRNIIRGYLLVRGV